jgi:hypothetical protein
MLWLQPAAALGRGAAAGTTGDVPAGEIVIVDISNTFNSGATGLVTPDDTSAAQEIAKAAPASVHVVKAFNTILGQGPGPGPPDGCRRPDDGALAGGSGPADDGPGFGPTCPAEY